MLIPPKATETNILLVADEGVIEALSPVMFVIEVEELLNTSVLVVLTTCNTAPG
jgi:hypothetical protein